MIDVVETDYGTVSLSSATLAKLNALDPKWREIAANKRRRGKHALRVKLEVRRVEDGAAVAAAIAFMSGKVLREF